MTKLEQITFKLSAIILIVATGIIPVEICQYIDVDATMAILTNSLAPLYLIPYVIASVIVGWKLTKALGITK